MKFQKDITHNTLYKSKDAFIALNSNNEYLEIFKKSFPSIYTTLNEYFETENNIIDTNVNKRTDMQSDKYLLISV
jgi:hypothetical protein